MLKVECGPRREIGAGLAFFRSRRSNSPDGGEDSGTNNAGGDEAHESDRDGVESGHGSALRFDQDARGEVAGNGIFGDPIQHRLAIDADVDAEGDPAGISPAVHVPDENPSVAGELCFSCAHVVAPLRLDTNTICLKVGKVNPAASIFPHTCATQQNQYDGLVLAARHWRGESSGLRLSPEIAEAGRQGFMIRLPPRFPLCPSAGRANTACIECGGTGR